jgi:WD40 repeat protein
METDQLVLCSFLDNTNSDRCTGQISMYNLCNGQTLSPVFRDAVVNRACLSGLDGLIIDSKSHFLALSSAYSTFQVYSFMKEKSVSRFFGHEKLTCIASEGDIAAAGTLSGSIYIWQISTGCLVNVLNRVHFQAVSCICFSSVYIASGSLDGTVKVWDKALCRSEQNLVPEYSFAAHSQEVSNIHFGLSGDYGCHFFTGSKDGSVIVYDLFDGSVLAKFAFPSPCVSFAVDACEIFIMVGCVDGNVYILDIESNNSEISAAMEKNGFHSSNENCALKISNASVVSALCLSLDDSRLIVGYEDGSIRFWDVATRQLIRQLSGPGKVSNISCFLKSSLSLPYGSRNFTPFKRNQGDEQGFLVALCPGDDLPDPSSALDSKAPSNLHTINLELFEFIEGYIDKH